MGSLGMPELIVILVIALLIFGPNKLPELGGSIAKAIRGFRKAMEEPEKKISDSSEEKEEKKDNENR